MNFFDVLKAIFDKRLWKEVSVDDKYKYFFLINRYLSIEFPLEINKCQIIGLGKQNSARMLDCWNISLSKRHSRAPNYIFTKSGSVESVEDPLKGISKEDVIAYMHHYRLDTKELNSLKKILPSELRSEVLAFRKSLNQ
jgi:hypothetical protein